MAPRHPLSLLHRIGHSDPARISLALIDGHWSWSLVIAMVIASVACHAGANMANDFFDFRKGVDNEHNLGPFKVIQLGLLTANQVRNGMIAAFALASVVGAYIVLATDWRVFVLAAASLGAAFFYTAGSKALGYVALGEVTVFLVMGPGMVCGAYYVLTGTVTWTTLLVSIPAGALSAATLHANNMRDIEHDRAAGKRTLATILGRDGSTAEYIAWIVFAYLAFLLAIVLDFQLWPIALGILTLPNALRLVGLARTGSGADALNRLLRKTAGLHLQLGGAMTAGLLVRALLDRT
ncbi:MAG: 1,4-dihydroxy-2-naphthoate octaprenyltransferase [Thermomicrobiales bacterium]|nr:1,4-dihydroxy-2-naphthoate octaprenyltransferase [Thermomicrobiales bacterium]